MDESNDQTCPGFTSPQEMPAGWQRRIRLTGLAAPFPLAVRCIVLGSRDLMLRLCSIIPGERYDVSGSSDILTLLNPFGNSREILAHWRITSEYLTRGLNISGF